VILDILKAVILGVVEGLTEFIPVSSTGHLILTSHFLSLNHSPEVFEVTIQLGAILAVVVLYWDFFKRFLSLKHWLSRDSFLVATAIFPAVLLGAIFHGFIKSFLFGTSPVIFALFVGGVIMIICDRLKFKPSTLDVSQITFKQALIIGLCQCVALWPGMSRSGSTIVGGILAKLDYATAARFSFIISVPVMVLAVAYDLVKSASTLTMYDAQLIAIGFVVSFFVALFAIKWFLKLLTTLKLTPFGVYRVVIALILALINYRFFD
jgi:undecaprenyl-diphosphatase